MININRLTNIRAEEKKYHDFCYDHYPLFEPGSWLHKPVKTVIDLVAEYNDQENLQVLDLGSGIGRNSIPIAESLKSRSGKVVCVDLLESAIDKLQYYSRKYGVGHYIESVLSDIEHFPIEQERYDIIIAVSALEHVSSERALQEKLSEMASGTKLGGSVAIVIGSSIKEVSLEDGQDMDPMFEVNISTAKMFDLLDQQYAGWEIKKRLVKPLQYEIDRNGQPVKLSTDCITYIAKRAR
ncbi:class I SAM-dependent methyltransferase [Paenibacillus sp. PL2-23]|uniref:class I SAM-dependent methyltransferase n=1 Tax=Paenibacillus sp. PL2-23 TaxID=2100729 RepID=UPI0030F5FEB2